MKLFYSPTSPYVRKVLVSAHEKGVAERIERLGCAANPINRDKTIVASNPSGKVPTLLLDDGRVLYDSRVICSYLDALTDTPRLMPAEGGERFAVMTLEALADAILDAAVLARYETAVRPRELYWDAWHAGQMEKIDSGLDALAEQWMALLAGPVNAGAIAAACALSYLDLRFPEKDWRAGRETLAGWFATFSERESMRMTVLRG
ncbi:glutathione S-transferase N-terminal domain-containing protein [Nitratireductor pacificus]|uniref:Glutathione S-transferase domain-containing protein n=1 Tax=Nitratireductor pacificus pht-3B TaxID=391937 RepID=K2N218_9HYPH|nr:glutathione S-transferase N-terminal domain-containing protein [Nitratireductor pacificus]EKF18278.1 glutathione S-transferase domain-containing protein [Nitratireductor pacificus pht-3B]